jgi:DNA-binding NtrC family response regulator
MALRGTILVADDEALARHSLVELLQEEGYHVYEAADGNTALQILAEADIDVVLSDLKMPGVDGLALLRKVRETQPQTMVILMTAYASVNTVVEALRLGAQDYLIKPLFLEDVLNKVRRLLEHKQQAWEVQILRRELTRHFDFDSSRRWRLRTPRSLLPAKVALAKKSSPGSCTRSAHKRIMCSFR